MSNLEVRRVETHSELEQAFLIRNVVFVGEQGVPVDMEIDEFENSSEHFLVFLDEVPVATGRLRVLADDARFIKFERIATLAEHRGKGIGRVLVEHMQDHATRHHPGLRPMMYAQESAIGFYEKMGWRPEGEMFMEAGIPHQKLVR